MPTLTFALMLGAVLFAAAITVWLMTLGGPGILVAALPAFLIAALAVRAWRR